MANVGDSVVKIDIDQVVTERIAWLVAATNRPVTISKMSAKQDQSWVVTAGFMPHVGDTLPEALAEAVRQIYGRQTMPPLPPGCEPTLEELPF